MATSFDDERVKLIIGDGASFMADEKNHGKFDIVIVDSSDPIGPASVLFENKFYSDISRVRSYACTPMQCNAIQCNAIGDINDVMWQ